MKRVMLGLVAATAVPSLLLLCIAAGQWVLRLPAADMANAALLAPAVVAPMALGLGLPGHFLLARMRWSRLGHYLMAGLWAGVAAWAVATLPFDLPPHGTLRLLPVAVACALLAAWVFWAIAVRPRERP
jgi:hypothetical protein